MELQRFLLESALIWMRLIEKLEAASRTGHALPLFTYLTDCTQNIHTIVSMPVNVLRLTIRIRINIHKMLDENAKFHNGFDCELNLSHSYP